MHSHCIIDLTNSHYYDIINIFIHYKNKTKKKCSHASGVVSPHNDNVWDMTAVMAGVDC